jgi:tetraacyldisaccharide 4'-kinase
MKHFHAPSFLHQFSAEWLWIFLMPLSVVWSSITYFRRKNYPESRRMVSYVPSICVGNVHSGGSGKTPLVLAISSKLSDIPHAIITRGYRGKLSKASALVDLHQTDGTSLYGDEAWMLAKHSGKPVYIGADRRKTLNSVEKAGACKFVLMDDGFQHLRVKPSLTLIAVNSSREIADSFCLPLGDLREPWIAIRGANAVVLVGVDSDQKKQDLWKNFIYSLSSDLPVFVANCILEKDYWVGGSKVTVSSDDKLGFFCGLAQPQGFQSQIAGIANSHLLKTFPDHHPYSREDVKQLIELKKEKGLTQIITTEKDWYKANPLFESFGERLLSLRIRYDLEEDFWHFLKSRIGALK